MPPIPMDDDRIEVNEIENDDKENGNGSEDEDEDDESGDPNFLQAGLPERAPKVLPASGTASFYPSDAKERTLFWILIVHSIITFILLLILVVPLIRHYCFETSYKILEVPEKSIATTCTSTVTTSTVDTFSKLKKLSLTATDEPYFPKNEYDDYAHPDDYANYYEHPDEEEYLSPEVN